MPLTIKYFDEVNAHWADITGSAGSVLRLDASGWTADNSLDDVVTEAYIEMSNDIKSVSLSVNGYQEIVTDSELTSGVLYFTAMYLTQNTTLTGIKWFQTTEGNYTAKDFNGIAIYEISGSTLIKTIDSNNDGDTWKKQSETWQKRAFKNPVTLNKGFYYIGFIYAASSETTKPRIGSGNWIFASNVGKGDFSNNRFLIGQYESVTALPSSINLTNITFNYSHIPFAVWAY